MLYLGMLWHIAPTRVRTRVLLFVIFKITIRTRVLYCTDEYTSTLHVLRTGTGTRVGIAMTILLQYYIV